MPTPETMRVRDKGPTRRRRRVPVWASAGVLLVATALGYADPPFVSDLRDAVFDGYQRIQPRPLGEVSPVRIIDIDEESLARYGQWPWPRWRLAELLDKLAGLQVAAVALDILLAEPDRTSPARLVELWRQQTPGLQGLPANLPDNDQLLADAVGRGTVVTSFALVGVSGTAVPALKAGFAFVGSAAPTPFPEFPGAVSTLEVIERAAQGNGALNVSLSSGGVIRRLPILLQVDDRVFPSLFAEALRVAQGADTYVARALRGQIDEVRIGAYDIPAEEGEMRLYASKPGTDRYVPAWKVLAGEVPAESVRGTIALVGLTGKGLQDVQKTPLGDDVPGVELHAQAVEQVVQETYLVRALKVSGVAIPIKLAELGLMLLLGLAVVVIGSRVGPTRTAIAGAAAVTAAFGVSWAGFTRAGLLIDPLLPAASVVTVYLVFSWLRHLQTERDKRWIREAFARFISPKLVKELVDNPEKLQLGYERRELTFLFTDLEGFTSYVEQTAPEVVGDVLNRYLDGLVQVAFLYDGTVDKIIGDAVHVMFGAPVADPRHAERAVACALDLDRFAQRFAAETQNSGVPFGRTRIGVNSGVAIVGNFGGALRFDYTAHGDAINTAARLEGANKYLGTRVCVSEHTVRLCPGFVGRPIGRLMLKGKSEAIEVFEPLPEDATPSIDLVGYQRAFALLAAADPGAEPAFADLVRRTPGDRLSAFHLQRLRAGETGSLVILKEK